VARALATRPELLLLDEVVAGLNPTETDIIIHLIRQLRENGITIFMVEHVMRAVLGVSDRIIVLNFGEKIAEGTPDEVASNLRSLRPTWVKDMQQGKAIMLEVKNINVFYGDAQALWDVSFRVDQGEIATLVGSNGREKYYAQSYFWSDPATYRGDPFRGDTHRPCAGIPHSRNGHCSHSRGTTAVARPYGA